MGRESCLSFFAIDFVQRLLGRLVFFDLAYLMELGRGDARAKWRNEEEIYFVIALLS